MAHPTDAFRAEHARIHEHLDHVRAWVDDLGALEPTARGQLGASIVSFFERHLAPHAEWEERVLYPAVDRYAGSAGDHPFTAAARHEHRVVERWTEDLRRRLEAQDWKGLARATDRLLGLVEAHFEVEEEVFLAVLDARMTPEAFERDILNAA